MQSGKGNHVDSQFSQISVQLTRKSKASGDTRHGKRDQMVQIAIGWGCEFQGTETDVIKGLIINAECLISVFHKLVNGKGGIVRFYDGVTDLKRKKNNCGLSRIRFFFVIIY